MRALGFVAAVFAVGLAGCGMPMAPTAALPAPPVSTGPIFSSRIPSATGTPNSVASLGKYSFVSVQGTGQIFTYDISSGSSVQVGTPYSTPCSFPSGMVITVIGARTIMAVPCYDTNVLLTLTISTAGKLAALGSVGGLPNPFPGIALEGTNVYVPLYGTTLIANGGVARVSIADPAAPVVTGMATLVSPGPNMYVNPGYLAVDNGYIYVVAGSENQPWPTTSSLQVVSAATMTAVGLPLTIAHSPQQIAISQDVAFVTFYDDQQLQSIDISNPAQLKSLQVLSLSNPACFALSILVRENFAYVGCYGQQNIERVSIDDPTNMALSATLAGISAPQRIDLSPLRYLMVTGSTPGGALYQIDAGRF